MTTSLIPGAREQLAEPCWRCGAHMEWRHGTFQCPRCRFKIGCCEGVTGECRESAPPHGVSLSAHRDATDPAR